MRMGRRVRVAVIGAVSMVVIGLAVVVGARWLTAGQAVGIAPPPGASEQLPDGSYEIVVDLRSSELHYDLRSDRGPATVDSYAMPPATTWEQARAAVAGQLDGWRQAGDCPDSGRQRTWCTWTEPARLWPRRVRIVFLRQPTTVEDRATWPDNTFLVIGSGPGGSA
ncbi:hypothetical protein AB0G04_35910 [Actinoplanes sp. NPDC023801]|uniref:hypothetical protein n=1 Tax=Actinoplanes sp. NPDC023801 TaxID=3154595 RepID=UPI0033C165E5